MVPEASVCVCVLGTYLQLSNMLLFALRRVSIAACEMYFITFKGMFAFIFQSNTTECCRRVFNSEQLMLTSLFLNVCFGWNATTVLVAGTEGRREATGGLGKALQIRSNYSSVPPFALSPYCIYCHLFDPLQIISLYKVNPFGVLLTCTHVDARLPERCLHWDRLIPPSAITSFVVFSAASQPTEADGNSPQRKYLPAGGVCARLCVCACASSVLPFLIQHKLCNCISI